MHMVKKLTVIFLVIVLLFALMACQMDSAQTNQASSDDSATLPTAGTTLRAPSGKDPKDINFALSLGWIGNESGARQRKGFEDAVAQLGGNLTVVSTEYDPKKQSEQIETIIKQKPDALFVTPSDPVAITEALNQAIQAGIPVFVSDGLIAGVPVTTTAYFDNFASGQWNMEMLCRKIGGSGKIAVIELPNSDSWDSRWRGAQYTLQFYPDVEVVGMYSYDPTGATTPRQAADNWLTQYPNKGDLKGIWCSWDDAAMQCLQAIIAAGLEGEVFVTGNDGGEICFETMKSSPSFICTAGEQIMTLGYQCVYYAHQYLQGIRVPRFINNGVGITREMLLDPNLPADIPIEDYDIVGNLQKLGWQQGFVVPPGYPN